MADLITLEEYKTSQGLTKLENDSSIQNTITSVSALVKSYCGHSIIDYFSSNKIETKTISKSSSMIQLDEMNVNSIVSVEIRETPSAAYTTLSSNDYYLDVSCDCIYRMISNVNASWPIGPGAVRITYKAGFQTCPEDLKLAVIDLINYYRNKEYKPNQTLGGGTRQNANTTTQEGNVSFPDHIKRVLDLYKVFTI